ncbi:OmpA family protein [Pseudomonadota bacterium]
MKRNAIPRYKRRKPLKAVILQLLMGLLVGSVCFGEDVIMFRGATPSAQDLADIMFPENSGQEQEESVRQGPRVRGIHVNPSAPTGKPAAAGSPFGFNINFAFDSDQVLPESTPYLDRVAEMLNSPQADNRRIVVIGHTDASGSASYNEALSKRRAIAVQSYLSQFHGIDEGRLQVMGKGEDYPLPGTEPYDPVNRRVEFHPAD